MNCNGKISFIASVLIGFLISLLGITATIAYMYVSSSWSPSSKTADKLLKKGKFNEALALINRVDSLGNNSSVLLEKGKIWMTLAWDREEKNGWRGYGRDWEDWLNSKEADSAEFYFKKAIKLFPENNEVHKLLGVLYMDRGWYSKAESEFIAALKINNKDKLSYNYMGVLYSREHDYRRAVKEFKKAYGLDSLDLTIVKNLVRVYRDYQNDAKNALIWINTYLNIATQKDSEFYSMLSSFNELSEKYPEIKLPESSNWKKKTRKFGSRGVMKFNP